MRRVIANHDYVLLETGPLPQPSKRHLPPPRPKHTQTRVCKETASKRKITKPKFANYTPLAKAETFRMVSGGEGGGGGRKEREMKMEGASK